MLNWSRLLFTTVVFATSLDSPAMVPRSLQTLAADWKSIVKSLQSNQDENLKRQELEKTDEILLENLKMKEMLSAQLLMGEISLREAAKRYRLLDKKVALLAFLKQDLTEEAYCQEVIVFLEGFLRSHATREAKQILYQLQIQLETHAGDSGKESNRESPGIIGGQKVLEINHLEE